MPLLALKPTQLDDSLVADRMDRHEIGDRIAIMRIQEETTYAISDYLVETIQLRRKVAKPVDEECRIKMSEWCYQVIDFCKFRRETCAIGMSFLDRYLSTLKGRESLCNRKEYQLAAMTSLYIAIKLHEPLEMETSLLADLSRGCYTEMEFVKMEQTILSALKFRVNGPTALGFVQHFVALLPDSVHPSVAETIMDYARFQTELIVADHSFVRIPPSELGLAAVMNAIEGLDMNLFTRKAQNRFIRNIEKYAEMFVGDVESIQTRLSLLMVDLFKVEAADYIQSAIQEMASETGSDCDDDEKVRLAFSRRHSPVSVMGVRR